MNMKSIMSVQVYILGGGFLPQLNSTHLKRIINLIYFMFIFVDNLQILEFHLIEVLFLPCNLITITKDICQNLVMDQSDPLQLQRPTKL